MFCDRKCMWHCRHEQATLSVTTTSRNNKNNTEDDNKEEDNETRALQAVPALACEIRKQSAMLASEDSTAAEDAGLLIPNNYVFLIVHPDIDTSNLI